MTDHFTTGEEKDTLGARLVLALPKEATKKEGEEAKARRRVARGAKTTTRTVTRVGGDDGDTLGAALTRHLTNNSTCKPSTSHQWWQNIYDYQHFQSS